MEKQKKNLGSVAFLPLIVFLVCYVGCGITFTLMGADDPFGKFPRHVALLAGCAVALLLNRSLCLHVIPVTFLIPGVFLMCCFISTSVEITMGTN